MDLEQGYQNSLKSQSEITDLGTIGLSDESVIDLEAGYQASRPAGVEALSGQIGKGLAFGYFDEIRGLEAQAQNYFKNKLGYDTGLTGAEAYAQKVNELRGVDAAYEKENPKTAVGLQILGALAPTLYSGGASLLTGSGLRLAPGVTGQSAKTLFGLGMESAPTVGQLIKMGAAQGALYGSGEAIEGNRLMGAVTGGTVGAVASPLVGKTLEKVIGAGADFAANRGWIGGKGLASTGAERGSIGFGLGGTSYTPEELYLAQQLKNTPIEKIVGGADELSEAVANDIPLFLPEAVNSPKVNRNARFIANYDPSMEFSQSAIAGRTARAEERATQLFNQVSPDSNPYSGAGRMRDAANDIIGTAEQLRADEAERLFGIAYKETPIISDPALGKLMEKDQVLTSAIKAVKKTANNADLPDNSTRILIKARNEISNKIEAAKAKGAGREARDLTDTYGRLNTILHKSDAIKAADAAFSGASQGIDALNDTFLKSLRNLTDEKLENVSKVLTMPAEQISKLRNTFEKAGKLDEWNAGIRAHLQSAAEGTREGTNFTNKLINNTTAERKLKAALGDAYEPVLKGLEYENRFFQGKNLYHAGSSTAGNLAEEQSTKEILGVYANLKNGNWTAALASMFENDMPETLAQEIAQIYFGPKRGAEALQKIVPLLEQYAANKTLASATGKGTGILAARGSADASTSLFSAPESGLGSSQVKAKSTEYAPLGKSGAAKPTESKSISTQNQAQLSQLESKFPSFNIITKGDQVNRKEFKTALKPPPTPEPQLTPIPSQLSTLDKRARIKKTAEFVASQPPLIQAIIKTESSGDPFAQSPTGPLGLMQLTRLIGKAYGAKDRLDPRQNVKAGTAFLQDLAGKYRDPKVILAAYNQGETVINRAIKKAGSAKWEDIKDLIPDEGRTYPEKVIKNLESSKVYRV